MSDWPSLMSGKVTVEEASSLVAKAAESLRAFLAARPEAPAHVLEILGRRLSGQLDAETWQVLDTSLSNYLGRDLAYLITWTAIDPDMRLPEVEKHASPEVMAFLRTILGLYGPELGNAFAVWNELPNNWQTIYRDVFFDQITQRHLLRLRIDKFSGEKVVIEGPADSIMNLTTGFIFTLRMVGTPDAFSQEWVDQFLKEVDQFTELIRPKRRRTPARPRLAEAA